MSPRSNVIPLSSNLQKEVQHLAAAPAMDNLVMQQFDTAIEKQRGLMESHFHGDDENGHFSGKMVANGQLGMFYQSFYKKIHTEILVDRNDKTVTVQKN